MSIFVSDHEFVNVSLVSGALASRGDGGESYFTSPTPANSALVSWPPEKTKSPPISGSTASTKRPVEVLPVASLTQPIRYGPPNPARLPIELISAIAPAAAVPESQAVGNVQNTPKVQKVPIAATVNATIVTDGLSM